MLTVRLCLSISGGSSRGHVLHVLTFHLPALFILVICSNIFRREGDNSRRTAKHNEYIFLLLAHVEIRSDL
jgi:hypothetical protein